MENQLAIRQVQIEIYNQRSTKLIKCLTSGDHTSIVEFASDLMPSGQPDFKSIRYYPTIAQQIPEIDARKTKPEDPGGRKTMRKAILLLVRNYCNSLSLADHKKPNEDQEIEIASYLLDECGNYRLEDYVMMFTLAKRNKLTHGAGNNKGRVFDRVDIQLISEFKEQYEVLRSIAEEEIREKEIIEKETLIDSSKKSDPDEPDEIKAKRWDEAIAQWLVLKSQWEQEKQTNFDNAHAERKRRYEIFKEFAAEPDHEKALAILAKRNNDNTQNPEP